MSDYAAESRAGLLAVRTATRICRSVQRAIALEAMAKQDRSPVTVADFASQAAICHVLRAHFPDDPVVGEENADELRGPEAEVFRSRIQLELAAVDMPGDEQAILGWIDHGGSEGHATGRERFWTLDPIDGTKGFLRGEQYAISLALIEDGEIKLGILGCPNLRLESDDAESPCGVLFHAVRGHGATAVAVDGDRGEHPRPVHVSGTTDRTAITFCESVESGHSAHGWSAKVAERLGTATAPVRLDSQAKYATVARGEADAYLRLPTRAGYHEKIWDHAGGVIVVEEAGGTVTDVDGRPLDFTLGRELTTNRGVVVTNGPLHATVLEAIAAAEADVAEPR